jgi:Tol biopolymer transport system component
VPLTVPSFVFVADADGRAQLFRFQNDSVVQLTRNDANNTEPRSAAGYVVFTSDRDGNPEVYLANPDLTVVHRVTNNAANDEQPALSPHGDAIAFESNRSGIARIWVVPAPALTDTGTVTPVPLVTGSPDYTPETSPVWSPDGSRIAFTSTRAGVSQVFVVAAGGGSAEQVTHEAGGAFSPAWSGDGTGIVFVSGTGTSSLRQVNVSTGATTDLAADSLGVGSPSCTTAVCLIETDPGGDGGSVIALSPASREQKIVFHRTSHERQPAVLVQ